MVIFRHTTLGGTPLDECSAQCRDLYLTAHNTQQETSTPPAGFEPAIPANTRLKPRDHNLLANTKTAFNMWKKELCQILKVRVFNEREESVVTTTS